MIMLEIIDAVAAWIVPAALRASIDGALFAAPAWLICRLAPSLPATLRTWLWWCVSLKLVLAALAVPGLAIEVLPASWAAALPSSHGSATGRGVDQPALAARMDQAVTATAPDHATREGSGSRQLSPPAASTLATVPVAEASSNAGLLESRWMPVGRILAIGWLGGIVIHLSLLLRHAWRCRSVVARAVAPAPELAAEHREIALRLGLTRVPRLLESSEVTVPQAVGALRPVVLVPSGTATRLSRRERAMVLCHELTHVRRADLALGWVPALAERVLVWHPVAWWAAREYALARESACDHAVLRALDTEAHDYGRLLVKLGVGRSVAGVAAAGASPSFHLLRRRLSMLQHFSPRASRTSSLSLLAVTLVVFLIPLRVVAERSVTVDWSGPRPIETATGDVPEADVSSASSPPAADRQGESKRAAARRDSRRLTAWIYVVDDHNVSMNGDSWDIETAKRARSSGAGPIFFFRRD